MISSSRLGLKVGNILAQPILLPTTQNIYKRNFISKNGKMVNTTQMSSNVFSNKPMFINESFIKNSNMSPIFSPKSVLFTNTNKIISNIRNFTTQQPPQKNNNDHDNNKQPTQQQDKESDLSEKDDENKKLKEQEDDEKNDQEHLKNLSTGEKIKFMLKKYGKLALIVHFSIYFATMGGFYLLFSSGVDINLVLDFLHIPRGAVNPSLGVFAVAFACTKISTFVRTPLTIITVPLLARYLSRGKKN